MTTTMNMNMNRTTIKNATITTVVILLMIIAYKALGNHPVSPSYVFKDDARNKAMDDAIAMDDARVKAMDDARDKTVISQRLRNRRTGFTRPMYQTGNTGIEDDYDELLARIQDVWV